MNYKNLVKVVDAEARHYVCLNTNRDAHDIESAAKGSCTVKEFMDALSQFGEENVYYLSERGLWYGTLCDSIDVDGGVVVLNISDDARSVDQIARTLTAAEVVRELSHANRDAKVVFRYPRYYYGYVTKSVIDEEEYWQGEEGTIPRYVRAAEENELQRICEVYDDCWWYCGNIVHRGSGRGCWYYFVTLVSPEEFEGLSLLIQKRIKGTVSDWIEINPQSARFIVWDTEEACREFGKKIE